MRWQSFERIVLDGFFVVKNIEQASLYIEIRIQSSYIGGKANFSALPVNRTKIYFLNHFNVFYVHCPKSHKYVNMFSVFSQEIHKSDDVIASVICPFPAPVYKH